MASLYTVGKQELYIAAILHSLDEILKYAFRILTRRSDAPCGSNTVNISANLCDRRKCYQVTAQSVSFQIGLQVVCPSTCPVSKYTELIAVELVTAIGSTVCQSSRINVTCCVSISKSLHSSLHGIGIETIVPNTVLILNEGRICILIELRQVVCIRSLFTCKTCCGYSEGVAVYAVTVGITGGESIQHSYILFIIGRYRSNSYIVQPSLLNISNTSVTMCSGHTKQLTINSQAVNNTGATGLSIMSCLQIGRSICVGHIPQNAFSCITCIICRGKDDYIRPIAACDGLTYYIIISIMVGLNYINLNTGQLSVLVPEFITVVLLCRNGTVNHNGDRFRLLNFRCSRCLLRRLCLAIGSGIR